MRRRYFNTSGPNIEAEHYTLKRKNFIEQGTNLVKNKRYFTIWAPRQTGKSTYFLLLVEKLKKIGYKPVFFSTESYNNYSFPDVFDSFCRALREQININVAINSLKEFESFIKDNKTDKMIIIIDEIEDLNPDIFNQFLHSIRNLYHSRNEHCLKSVILVGVSNIVGIIRDNASPFNIADNLELDFFSDEETLELLGMHEKETGQLFSEAVKKKISEVTANQPGLVNAFAQRLITQYPEKKILEYEEYLKIENWFLNFTIDKNIQNIKNKAAEYRSFVEILLFSQKKIPYQIDKPEIEFLHTQGLITSDEDDKVKFWVPLYRKKLYSAFYPYSNGESKYFFRNVDPESLTRKNVPDYDRIIENYKAYIKKRGFRYFREKDKETGEYLSIKEAALVYSFETYIQSLLEDIGGKSYLEPHTGLGRSDLIINIHGVESVIEFKVYKSPSQFRKGKKQVAYYAKSLGLKEAVYLVFVPVDIDFESIKETKNEIVNDISITSYIIRYDEEKDF